MGVVRSSVQVKLFCALLYASSIAPEEVEAVLEPTFGAITLRSTPMPFTQTTYYDREMGTGLIRSHVAFAPLVGIADLAVVKHRTNALEQRWATHTGQRQVNLDPGYLDLAKVVLATTKDHMHRLYIGAGMFAEITLRYQGKSFHPWDWTYPDYRLPTTLAFFNQLREQYKTQRRHQASPTAR